MSSSPLSPSQILKSLVNQFPNELNWDGVYSCQTLPAAILSDQSNSYTLKDMISKSCGIEHLKARFSNFKNYSLFHFAAIANRFELLKSLFKSHLIDKTSLLDSENNSPLHLRAQHIFLSNHAKDPFIKTFLELCLSQGIDCHQMKNKLGQTYLSVLKTPPKDDKNTELQFGDGVLKNSKYTRYETPNLERIKEVLKNAKLPFSRWPSAQENESHAVIPKTNLASIFNEIISTPALTIELIRQGLLTLNELNSLLINSQNWSFKNRIEETLFKGHLLNAYLLADCYDFLKYQNYLHYFELFIEIFKDYYTRAMDSCPNNPVLSMLLFTHHNFVMFHNQRELLVTNLSTYEKHIMINMFETEDYYDFFKQIKEALEAKDSEKLLFLKDELQIALKSYYNQELAKVLKRQETCDERCESSSKTLKALGLKP